ncbi:MAG: hypothetical protein H6704_03400 [Myxococcales bacterium]|nr:hypothetical protein [Myxococcales bacterium]
MPSVLHDTLVDLFRHCPTLALMLAGDRIPGAAGRARIVEVGDSTLSRLAPPTFEADLVLGACCAFGALRGARPRTLVSALRRQVDIIGYRHAFAP